MDMGNVYPNPDRSVVKVMDEGDIVVHAHFNNRLIWRQGCMEDMVNAGYTFVLTEESMIFYLWTEKCHVW
jgi:hypothetical protein